MKEIENELDSADKSSKDNLDKKDCLLSIAPTPLSEMVWSQNRGLRVQYVASSLTERKASVLWNTESFNIVVSSPKCSNRESSISDEGSSYLIRTKSNSESTGNQSSKTCGNLKLSNRTELISTTNEVEKTTMDIDSPFPDLNTDPDPTHPHAKLVTPLNASSSKYAGNLKYFNKSSKGKEHVIYDLEEDKESASKGTEDSQDSIESCNSKRLTLRTKRARASDYKTCRENKRLKKHVYNGTGSSFMNWVSAITNGFSGFTKATPLSFAPPLSSEMEGNLNYYSLSNEDGKDMGFKSIFKSLYLPNLIAKKVNINSLQVISNEVTMPIEGVQSSASKNLVSNDKNDFVHNSWITRFSPRVSETIEKSGNNLQEVELRNSKDQDWLKIRNQKMKCEPNYSTSNFAKRMDNWKKSTKCPNISGNVPLTMTTCLFCGKRSHGMKACS